MAAIEFSRPMATGLSVGGRFIQLARNLVSDYTTWRQVRATKEALEMLSDQALEDIGLCRGDIDAISARRAR